MIIVIKWGYNYLCKSQDETFIFARKNEKGLQATHLDDFALKQSALTLLEGRP